jgi:hydrogenase nickel incorporation protein HypB
MCEECGCAAAPSRSGRGHDHDQGHEHRQHDHADNEHTARHNREHFIEHGVLAVSLIGAPGSGKTELVRATAQAAGSLRLGAIKGDLASGCDAQRLGAAGVRSTAIITGAAWHLDAEHVHNALHDFPLGNLDYLFVEHVGDLISSALHDLGQAVNVVVLSVTEGEAAPLKYPVTFRKADLVVLSKIDLLPHLPEVRVEAIEEIVARLMPRPALIPVSARTGQGIDRWIDWLAGACPSDSKRIINRGEG